MEKLLWKDVLMKITYLFSSFFLTIILLQGCGGGGGDGGGSTLSNIPVYTGATTEARVDTTNSEDLSTAAGSGALQAVVADAASVFAARPVPSLEAKLLEIAPRISQWIIPGDNAYAAKITDVSTGLCDAGGSAIADTNDAETVGTFIFTDCAMSDGVGGVMVLNGTVDYTAAADLSSLTMVFRVTVSYVGESEFINMTIACSGSSCTVTSDFFGLDDRVYRITGISLSGNPTSGFYISATIYDPDHGYVTMTTSSPITFGCPTGVPGTGVVVLNGAVSTLATISFDSCSAYTVTIDGVGYLFNW
ncbi:MAG: hypothetical protein KZQ75_05435 [Candidatus Thiodiazotropha sp. (ex Myrtea spinifera)]|nr:hypothetical protein [Candidatus Thiodiazotropha sp. (ex Myrtea spinifera)]